MSRDLVKVYCQRNDLVGTVIADAEGLRFDYTAAVLHTDGTIFGSSRPCVMRLADDDVTEFKAYCTRCKAPVALSVRSLRAAALDGLREIHMRFATAVDKEWVDAGWEASYPPGTNWFRHDPRCSGD